MYDNSLKIMLVRSMYSAYFEKLKNKHKNIETLSYSNQIRCILHDGYGALHTPFCLGCETFLVYANCHVTQKKWLEEHGKNILSQQNFSIYDILKLQITHFKPDVLYLTDPINFDARFLATLDFTPPCILGWRAADIPMNIDWTGFDGILSNVPKILAFAKTSGAREGYMFLPHVPSWIVKEVQNIPQDTDVVFVGSISPTQHAHRLAFLEYMAEAASVHGFSLALYLSCNDALISPAMRHYVRPPVFGIEMHKALRRGRIIVNSGGTVSITTPSGEKMIDLGGEDVINMRLFEGTSGGSLVLTEDLYGVRRYFEPDEEIVTYTDPQDAVAKSLYYLKHTKERECIAKAGQDRCLREWNMKNGAQRFLEISKEILSNK